jgi:hypothetical protein
MDIQNTRRDHLRRNLSIAAADGVSGFGERPAVRAFRQAALSSKLIAVRSGTPAGDAPDTRHAHQDSDPAKYSQTRVSDWLFWAGHNLSSFLRRKPWTHSRSDQAIFTDSQDGDKEKAEDEDDFLGTEGEVLAGQGYTQCRETTRIAGRLIRMAQFGAGGRACTAVMTPAGWKEAFLAVDRGPLPRQGISVIIEG